MRFCGLCSHEIFQLQTRSDTRNRHTCAFPGGTPSPHSLYYCRSMPTEHAGSISAVRRFFRLLTVSPQKAMVRAVIGSIRQVSVVLVVVVPPAAGGPCRI